MKKILTIALLFFCVQSFAQVTQVRLGENGKKYIDTIYVLPKTAGLYWNSYGDWVSLSDTIKNILHTATATSKMKLGWDGTDFVWKDTTSSGGSSNWTLSGSNIYNNNTGNVGINTGATPAAKITFRYDSATTAAMDSSHGFLIENRTATVGENNSASPPIYFRGTRYASGVLVPMTWRMYSIPTSNTASSFNIDYNIGGGTTYTNAFNLNSTGGITFPGGVNTNALVVTTSGVDVTGTSKFRTRTAIGTSTANFYAQLDLQLAYGLGLPRNTTTVRNTWTAFEGLANYNTTAHGFEVYDNVGWNNLIQVPVANTKITAAAPYSNDGYISVNIGGTVYKLMTTP